MKETWLRCWISPGQFSVEYAVSGEMFNGTGFSLFASEDDVEFDTPPFEGQRVPGWIRVQILDSKPGLLLVCLPQQTLENGQTVTVQADQVEQRPARQEA